MAKCVCTIKMLETNCSLCNCEVISHIQFIIQHILAHCEKVISIMHHMMHNRMSFVSFEAADTYHALSLNSSLYVKIA